MMPQGAKPLTDADFERLKGIDREILQQASLCRVDSLTGAGIVGRNGHGDYSGILIPYYWPGGDGVREYRLRRDHPEMEVKNGEQKPKDKYLSPSGARNMLYFPPGIDPAWLEDPKMSIVLTEGAQKALALHCLAWHDLGEAADRPRWVSSALSGVDNWKGVIGKADDPDGVRVDVKGVIPDFDRIEWKGRTVKIVFDSDVYSNKRVGDARKFLAIELRKRGATVSFVDIPKLPEVNGIDDLVARQGKTAVLDRILSETSSDGGEAWDEPVVLGKTLPLVRPFDPDLLPPTFRRLVEDAAERMQVPMDLVAIPLIVALSSVVGRRAVVQPKAIDDTWKVILNLWGCVIAPPGSLKTPALRLGMAALSKLEEGAQEGFELQKKQHKQEVRNYKVRESVWQSQAKKKASEKDGGGRFDSFQEDEPEPPKATRYIVNDATVEALQEILAANPPGVALVRDELSGWFAELEKPGHDGDRGFMLESWDGNTSRDSNRIGRGFTNCKALCVSLMGGMQPDTFRAYAGAVVGSELSRTATGRDDGLIQRLQLLVWPDTGKDWKYVDREPNRDAINKICTIFEKLSRFDHKSPVQMRFDPEAQELFVQWLTNLEGRMKDPDLHPVFVGHLSKYRSLVPTLAGLFELTERVDADQCRYENNTVHIGLESLQRAILWDAYLESHAKRAYSCLVLPEMQAAYDLSLKIKQGKLGTGKFKVRDVYQKGWKGMNSPESAQKVMVLLHDADWIRPVEYPTLHHRKPNEYEINPRVFQEGF
jgi:hypothetical protein